MKFITLPSGTIVNLAQVAFIHQPEEAQLWVTFSGTAKLPVKGDDIEPFLNAIKELQIDEM
jgi:hypothetical protein